MGGKLRKSKPIPVPLPAPTHPAPPLDFALFPMEVWLVILSFLRPADAINLEFTSMEWKLAITDELLKKLFGASHEYMRKCAITLPRDFRPLRFRLKISDKKSDEDTLLEHIHLYKNEKNDSLIRKPLVLVHGMLGTGRSAFTMRLVEKKWVRTYDAQAESTYRLSHQILPGRADTAVTIALMDTAFESTVQYAPNMPDLIQHRTEGLFILFGIDSRIQFRCSQVLLESFLQCRKSHGAHLPPIMLIASKMDIDIPREEKQKLLNEASEYARKIDIGFSAVSSKFDCNLNEVMSAMLKMMLKVRYDEGFKATISKRLLENDELQTLLNIEIERSKRSPDLL